MQIRRMNREDCVQVAAIEAESFSDPWSQNAFEETVGRPNYRYFVAEEEGEILGYCCFFYVLDEAEIPNVCVSERARNRGIGKEMLQILSEEAKSLGVRMLYLEVRRSNLSAQKLYQSTGFFETGLRKNFYEQPREDAILMCKIL